MWIRASQQGCRLSILTYMPLYDLGIGGRGGSSPLLLHHQESGCSGPVDMAGFILRYDTGAGDYTGDQSHHLTVYLHPFNLDIRKTPLFKDYTGNGISHISTFCTLKGNRRSNKLDRVCPLS